MDRPSDDADSGEIARFLEEDFWDQISEDVDEALSDSEGENS
jgi:hypothetical protein